MINFETIITDYQTIFTMFKLTNDIIAQLPEDFYNVTGFIQEDFELNTTYIPSLLDLQRIFKQEYFHPHHNSNYVHVLEYYMEEVKKEKNNDKQYYYLGGQLKITFDTKITTELLREVVTIHNQRLIDYGGPTNSFEAMSIQSHIHRFEILNQMISEYYVITISEYSYAPGKQGFLDSLCHWNTRHTSQL